MKISKEAIEYADSMIKQSMRDLSVSLREIIDRMKGFSRGSTLEYSIAKYYLDYLDEVGKSIVRIYLKTYKEDGVDLDEVDLEEILEDISYRFNNSNAPVIPSPLNKEETIKKILNDSRHTLLLSARTAAFGRRKEENKIMAENLIAQKEARRYRVLNRIYMESNANTLECIQETDIAEKEQLTREELDDALRYLVGEGLIKPATFGTVSILHRGIKEIEESIRNPDRGTEHFQPTIIQNFYGTTIGVQAGTQNSSQSISINVSQDFDNSVSELLNLVRSAPLPDLQKDDVIEAIERLPKLAKMEKTPDVIDTAKKKLDLVKTTLEVGTNLATVAMPYLQYLYTWFQN
jgi:hypothetical protein